MLGLDKPTPKATDVAQYLCDVERVNLCDYLPRISLLLQFHMQERIRMGDVSIHLADCFGVFQGFVATQLSGTHESLVWLYLRVSLATKFG